MMSVDPTREPPPELMAMVRSMQPVALRRPKRQLATVIAVSIVYAAAWLFGPAVWIWGNALRPDLAQVPRAWLVVYAALCLAGFVAPLCVALLPCRGQLLHRVGLAAASAWLVWLVLVAAALFARVAPGVSLIARSHAQLVSVTAQCAAAMLSVALVPTALSLWALRRAIPLGNVGVAAAIGAAGGALGGLVLHLHCPWAQPIHVLFGHAAPVAVTAAAAAIVGRKLLAP